MTSDDLAGRVALVTGATGTLGEAVCRALAGRGAVVVGAFHRAEHRADELVAWHEREGYVLRTVAADLTDPDARSTMLERVREIAGPPDIVVCSHGITQRRSLLDKPAPDGSLWALNVDASIALVSAAAKGMLRRRFGRLVLVGSRAGMVGMPGQAAYAATKAALQGWAASAAWELGPFGITVNVVAPGAVQADPDRESVYSKDEDELVASRTAVRRLGTPAEIAATVAFLTSPLAGYVSGQTIAVDGGARW
ncbi:MAG: SDR family NAD(P)-dependent oxidoreductase [Frankiaceae bacterium]